MAEPAECGVLIEVDPRPGQNTAELGVGRLPAASGQPLGLALGRQWERVPCGTARGRKSEKALYGALPRPVQELDTRNFHARAAQPIGFAVGQMVADAFFQQECVAEVAKLCLGEVDKIDGKGKDAALSLHFHQTRSAAIAVELDRLLIVPMVEIELAAQHLPLSILLKIECGVAGLGAAAWRGHGNAAWPDRDRPAVADTEPSGQGPGLAIRGQILLYHTKEETGGTDALQIVAGQIARRHTSIDADGAATGSVLVGEGTETTVGDDLVDGAQRAFQRGRGYARLAANAEEAPSLLMLLSLAVNKEGRLRV